MEKLWREGHALVVSALNPTSGPEAKKFNATLQSRAKGRKLVPLSEDEVQKWFSYDAFLELLGLVNINLEDSGGLYALHCHMNHSCEPNIQVSRAGRPASAGRRPHFRDGGRPRRVGDRESCITLDEGADARSATCRGTTHHRRPRRCRRPCRRRILEACEVTTD